MLTEKSSAIARTQSDCGCNGGQSWSGSEVLLHVFNGRMQGWRIVWSGAFATFDHQAVSQKGQFGGKPRRLFTHQLITTTKQFRDARRFAKFDMIDGRQ